MIPRHSALITTAVVAGVIGLSACTPVPTPEPTPTPLFASEAEAFKAAEQVYRDYNTAGAQADAGDANARPETFLAGAALDEEIAGRRDLEANGLSIRGRTDIALFNGLSSNLETSRVAAIVCLDVSGTRIFDNVGNDVTPTERPTTVPLQVDFARSGSSLVIVKSASADAKC
ncbi:hypothetical protein [Microbacterium azadirachtae]|uniref:hypothetical protein n=1 Tax=Microbacterium azadirachtae TaxID=582680 RepID=UPI000A7C4942|nr:hypothetical protein [Microbacterium azadirachtae]